MALFNYAAALVAACLFSSAAAADKDEFPLVWVCLGITVAGVIVALYVAYLRPAELRLPGCTVMTAQESEPAGYGGEYPSQDDTMGYVPRNKVTENANDDSAYNKV